MSRGLRFQVVGLALLLAAAAASAAAAPAAGWLEVRFFAAGYGDSALLTTPEGHQLLLDAGRATAGDHLVQRRLLPFFRKRGIRKLDAFFVSHPHWDHYGDPLELRRHVPFEVLYVNRDGEYALSDLAPPGEPLPFRVLSRGEVLRFGSLSLEVLHPPAGGKPPEEIRGNIDDRNWRSVLRQENNRSLVLRATYGKVSFLFVGDLSYEGERALLSALRGRRARKALRAEVLKLGHHGIRSSSEAWLEAVRPRFAVATCGEYEGKERSPFPDLLQRLRRRRVQLLRTDRDGDLLLRTDGKRIEARRFPDLVFPERRSQSPRGSATPGLRESGRSARLGPNSPGGPWVGGR
jgi:competence protein ComEC